MSTTAPMAPTYGLRTGAFLVLAGGVVLALLSPWSRFALMSTGISIALVLPVMRRGHLRRGYVALVATAWFLAAAALMVLAVFWIFLPGFVYAVALVAGASVALMGCGIGWGNDD
jgi:hypothetical protein